MRWPKASAIKNSLRNSNASPNSPKKEIPMVEEFLDAFLLKNDLKEKWAQ